MNETIKNILSHRSIRRFKDEPIPQETIETLVQCAQSASTSSYQQVYSIIGVEEQSLKDKLAELAGNQSYVAQNGYFFVFCLDYHRHKLMAEMTGGNVDATVQSKEGFMVGMIDVALASQNLAMAAESLGLGIVYIGGIRNNLPEVSELLRCPDHVVPLFGMAVGFPDASPGLKPRLPQEAVFHKNQYKDDEKALPVLKEFEMKTAEYYKERTGGARDEGWATQMARVMAQPKRTYMKEFIESKGLDKQ
ncbi:MULTISPECIES: oxygen-insensitive NADPH nitroreductase [unclassified Fictibacillus]|uniref:oxygen-insensitive NADPH nitroreductase n=1 Tax=unclassified Fictibacillus TaxID=2644029 RepID=UPI0006A769D1|nr:MULTISPECIES: oxygen-insensitive NADPH nitroreductase [unclassified Fictibacillus]UZJ78234.1 oxygen-insensitive NADPH nitroreductase [Fictibacillus sp. KU28468]